MKTSHHFTIGAVALAAGFLSIADQARAAAFQTGDIAVERLATTGTGGASSAVFIDEYSPTGTLVQSISIPSTGAGAFTNSNSATSEGLLNLSNNNTLVLAGYNNPSGVGSIKTAGTYAAGVLASDGTFSIPATATNQGDNFRSATASGTSYYGSNAKTGIILFNASGAPTALSTTVTNTRSLEIYNNNLYFSTGSGTRGIYQVGTGLPTTAGTAATNILQLSSSSSPYGFSISPDGATAFVVDSGGTLSKYAVNANSGASAQTAISSISGLSNATGLTVSYSGNTATLYVVTPTALYSVTDTINGTSNDFGTLTSLGSGPGTGFAFRGLDFAPTAVPEPATWAAGALSVLALVWVGARRAAGLFGMRGA